MSRNKRADKRLCKFGAGYTSRCRPVTPEIAGSSPVNPATMHPQAAFERLFCWGKKPPIPSAKGITMASSAQANFTATDGTGLWEVTSAGIRVNGELWRFTDRSFVVCAVTSGRTERSTRIVEDEDDGFGDLAALAVLQETGSFGDAALTRWALGGSSTHVETTVQEIPGSAQLTIGGLQRPRDRDCSLRYREDGRWIQAQEIQAFGSAAHAAVKAFRERWGSER